MTKYLNKIQNKLLGRQNQICRYLLKLKRTYKIKKYKIRNRKVVEICGGRTPLSIDNLNVDIADFPEVDLITDLTKQPPFKDNEIDEIISIATLEHFNIVHLRQIFVNFIGY